MKTPPSQLSTARHIQLPFAQTPQFYSLLKTMALAKQALSDAKPDQSLDTARSQTRNLPPKQNFTAPLADPNVVCSTQVEYGWFGPSLYEITSQFAAEATRKNIERYS